MTRPKHLYVENRVKATGNFSLGKLTDSQISDYYTDGKTQKEISRLNETSISHIHDVLVFNNIPRRVQADYIRGTGKYSELEREAKDLNIDKRTLARRKLLETLGGCCKKCGIDDFRVLQINHINGYNGVYRAWDYTRRFVEKDFDGIEITCANCNILYEFEKGRKEISPIKAVEPEIFVISESTINWSGVQELLEHLGVEKWDTDASSDIEYLIELYGRLCYMSFGTELNPNITKVREGNKNYIQNIIKSKHGSVLEHGVVNFVFRNVSRVFTAELCRHRAGTAFSEQSLRFVRLTDLNYYVPVLIEESEAELAVYSNTFQELSNIQKIMAELTELDDMSSFSKKKEITSAVRRLAPLGLATNIGFSCNMRTLRHLIELRTNTSAEEEIRLVFDKIGYIAKEKWPNIFYDFQRNDDGEWIPEYSKI